MKFHYLVVFIFLLLIFYCCTNDNNPIESDTNNNNPLNLVTIPSGTFSMGSPTSELDRQSNEIQHTVTLSSFKISKYEITNSQFAAFLNNKKINSSGIYKEGSFPNDKLIMGLKNPPDYALFYADNSWRFLPGFENFPVVLVSWYGAVEFANYHKCRLPTEAEWEYACRAGTTTPFFTGNNLSNKQANYNWLYPYISGSNDALKCPNKPQAVGSYPANGFGLYDTHGNVSEICADYYGEYSDAPQTNPQGPNSGISGNVIVVRGGNWETQAKNCRSARRSGYLATDCLILHGFRIASSN